LKDRKVIIVGAVAIVVVIALILISMPSGQKTEGEYEVISKRAKLTEETVGEAPPAPFAEPVQAMSPQEPVEPVAPFKETLVVPPPPVKEAPFAPLAEKKGPVKTAETSGPTKDVKAEKERKPAGTVKAAKPKRPEEKTWAINVGSFASLPDAQNLAISLRKAGYRSYVAEFTRDSVKWHRVRVGFYSTRAEAEETGRGIQSRFRVDTPWIVKPDRAELESHR